MGCCGCPVARPKYHETFESVEIQQTFYQLPQSETARRWRAEAPEVFLFTLKAWQLVTHEPTSPTYRRLKLEITPTQEKCYCFFKPTDEVFAAWKATRLFAAGLKAKWLLFQSPASFTPGRRNKKNRVRFFSSLNRKGMDLIWEPRGKWGEDEVKELCKELDLVHCVDPLKNFPSYGRFRYFPLHGRAGHRSRYESSDLQKVAELCEGKTCCFFNHRFMLEDGMKFLHRIRERSQSA